MDLEHNEGALNLREAEELLKYLETNLKEASLRKEAVVAATWRGHALKWSAPWHGEYASVQTGECTHCHAEVTICTRPLPNQIDIGGSAVAISCERTASR